MKEKLKEKIRKGEANEDDYNIEFSSDEEEDDNDEEVTIQDDFTLPKKMWRKLYRCVNKNRKLYQNIFNCDIDKLNL